MIKVGNFNKLLILIALAATVLSCTTLSRGLVHWGPEADDYKIFTQDTIHKSDNPFHFKEFEGEFKLDNFRLRNTGTNAVFTYDELIDSTIINGKNGGAFILIQNDTIKYERYRGQFDRYTDVMLFSVSKSITSLLCGIAVDKGLIESIDDPVTKYLMELNDADPMFKKLTIRHLLDMRSGIKHPENYINPFKGTAKLYYGTNQMAQVKKLKFRSEPGTEHDYISMATTVLGLVIESVIDMPLAQFAHENVWQPLGMERDGTIALDDPRNRSAKTFAGFNSNVMDLAKIGRLYLNGGEWNGQQIVSKEWVEQSLTADASNKGYSLCWYMNDASIRDKDGSYYFPDSTSIVKRYDELQVPENLRYYWEHKSKKEHHWEGRYYLEGENYAYGINDQILYINRKKNIIMVRLGINWSYESVDWLMHRTAEDYLD